MGVRDIT